MRAMIHDQDLSMYLWGEACSTSVYVQNRSPHRILGDKTPEEVFTRVTISVSLEDIWMACVLSCAQVEKIKVGPFWEEEHFCRIQRDLEVLQDLCTRTKIYRGQSRCYL